MADLGFLIVEPQPFFCMKTKQNRPKGVVPLDPPLWMTPLGVFRNQFFLWLLFVSEFKYTFVTLSHLKFRWHYFWTTMKRSFRDIFINILKGRNQKFENWNYSIFDLNFWNTEKPIGRQGHVPAIINQIQIPINPFQQIFFVTHCLLWSAYSETVAIQN